MSVTMDGMIWVGDLYEEDPLIYEPVVEERYSHATQTEDTVTIIDEEEPFATITSDEYYPIWGCR